MLGLTKPCLACGELTTNASRCDLCQSELLRVVNRGRVRDRDRGTTKEQGYDGAWRRLSERARKLQPWCSDCGRQDELTCDHSPEAWKRKAEGKRIRLQDVTVLCTTCNSDRGSSRPGSRRYAEAVG